MKSSTFDFLKRGVLKTFEQGMPIFYCARMCGMENEGELVSLAIWVCYKSKGSDSTQQIFLFIAVKK